MNWEKYTEKSEIDKDELILGLFKTYPSRYIVGYIDKTDGEGVLIEYAGYDNDWYNIMGMPDHRRRHTLRYLDRFVRLYPKDWQATLIP